MNFNTADFLNRQQTDVLRGLAAVIIAVFHVFLEWEFPRVFNLAGSVAVAVFLFLSGFGINESYKHSGLRQYWRKRLRRIVVPYFLFVTVLQLFNPDFTWRSYLLDITFIRSSYWFIGYLMYCYVAYWLARRFFGEKGTVAAMAVSSFIGLNLLSQIEAEQSVSFLAGVLFSMHIDTIRRWTARRFLTVAGVAFAVGFFFLMLKEIPAVHAYKGTLAYNYILLMIKLPIAAPLIVLPLLCPAVQKSRLLFLSGISSLEIYLTHLAVLRLVNYGLLGGVSFVVATVLLTFLFYQINNRLIPRFI